MYFVYKKNNRL